MGWEFPGSKNTNRYTKFRFACPDNECPGHKTFHASMEEPPEFVPSGCPCPFGGDHDAKWIIDKGPAVHIHGTAGGERNPHYTTAGAESEHRWMEQQIEEARKAVEAQDQIDGTAVSPYSKFVPNYEEMEKKGIVKRDSQEVSEQKRRQRDDLAKKVAEQAADKIDREIEQRHIGRRHDG